MMVILLRHGQYRAGLRWRSQFALQPTCRFGGFKRIDKCDHLLMNVIAGGALECPDVKTRGTGCDAGQHGSCLARRAKWPEDDHDASPWIRRESYALSHRWMPKWGGDGTNMRFRTREPVINIAQSSKFHEFRPVFHRLNRNHLRLRSLFKFCRTPSPTTSEE